VADGLCLTSTTSAGCCLVQGDGPSYRSTGREDLESGMVDEDAETDSRLQNFYADGKHATLFLHANDGLAC